MTVCQIISEYGRQAVLRYRDVAGVVDDEMPEAFLGGNIACGLHDQLGLSAHVERHYQAIARERGIELSQDLVSEVGGLRADVAIYRDREPIGIVELKIFKDGGRTALIASDLEKMRKMARLCNIEMYAGVWITDTTSKTWDLRLNELQEALGQACETKCEQQQSRDGKWSWSFATWKFTSS